MSNLIPAPGIILVVPRTEKTIGQITIAAPERSENAVCGIVVAVGSSRDDGIADLKESISVDFLLYYTDNGARDLGEVTAVDYSCILAWEAPPS